MDFVVPKKKLIPLLEAAVSVTERRSATASLAAVLLRARGGLVSLAASDNYRGIACDLAAEVLIEGTYAIPGKDLLDRVKVMPDGPIQIQEKDGRAIVRAIGTPRLFGLACMPEVDFTKLPECPAEPLIVLSTSVLADLIERARYSVSTDETRPQVNSLLIEFWDKGIKCVSTDGHRLTVVRADVEASRQTMGSHLLPQKAIGDVANLCAAGATELRFSLKGNTMFFQAGGIILSVRVVEAIFPPYASILPLATAKPVRIDRLKLLETVKAVQLAASDRSGVITVSARKDRVVVTTETPETGSGHDETEASYDGKDVTVGVNAKYLLETLVAMAPVAPAAGPAAPDEVVISLSENATDPIRIDPSWTRDVIAVLMPMRI